MLKKPNLPLPYIVSISVKGIVFDNHKVWLRKNERDEWELPGGKLDEGEQPEETVVRELSEELGFRVNVVDIIQSHLYTIQLPDKKPTHTFVVSYLCDLVEKGGSFEIEGEAGRAEFEALDIPSVNVLNMPFFYKEAIKKAYSFRQSYVQER